MKLTIILPETYYKFGDSLQIEKEFKLNNALMLYKQGKISLSMGSELAETDIYSFMQFCKDNLIPVIDTSATELEEELTNYKSLIK